MALRSTTRAPSLLLGIACACACVHAQNSPLSTSTPPPPRVNPGVAVSTPTPSDLGAAGSGNAGPRFTGSSEPSAVPAPSPWRAPTPVPFVEDRAATPWPPNATAAPEPFRRAVQPTLPPIPGDGNGTRGFNYSFSRSGSGSWASMAGSHDDTVHIPEPETHAPTKNETGVKPEPQPTASSAPKDRVVYMYDLVIGITIGATVIIIVLLFLLHRNRKRKSYQRNDGTDYALAALPGAKKGNDASKDDNSEVTELDASNLVIGNSNGDKTSPSMTPAAAQTPSGDFRVLTNGSQTDRRSSRAGLRRMGSSFIDSCYAFARHSPTSSTDSSSTSAKGALGQAMGDIWNDPVIVAARVPFDQVKFGEALSKGGFGEVFEGEFQGRLVAVKRLLPDMRRQMVYLEDFLCEVRMMTCLKHARIVEFLGVAWDAPKDLCILTEFMERGDLRNILAQWRRTEKAGWNRQKLTIALHIAEALAYLHALLPKKIIHRDLKSKNVLLNNDWDAKLSDFGISREQNSERTMTGNVGSSMWIAPEVMMGRNYNEKADIFSFGIVLTELDTHMLPYHSVTTPDGRRVPDAAILHMVMMGKVQATFSSLSRTDMVLLGRACLNLEPARRPTAQQLAGKIRRTLESI